MLQTKEQGKNLQDQINEEEIGNQPEEMIRERNCKKKNNIRKYF